MDTKKEKKAWREVRNRNRQRFFDAFRGMRVFWMTTSNLFRYVSSISILIVVILGFYFKVSCSEWMDLIFAIGFVLVSEAFNTAIEIDIDLTSPEYHPYARDTKDAAAAAVLLSVFVSVIVGFTIFLPKIF
ncbi:MAG: diacylglycerol kinase family protein [Candidatus Pacebacteria bacterium]|nr:diacylglycerol kinase family protein [Candidatus Paceibacterota bacterium]